MGSGVVELEARRGSGQWVALLWHWDCGKEAGMDLSRLRLSAGDWVEIMGLSGAPEHNGKKGTIVRWSDKKGRFIVDVGLERPIAVRPENLTPMAMVPRPQDTFNDPSLMQCSVKDQAELCQAKLEAGSDPNSCNRMGQTALHVAAIWGSMGVGQLLVDAGANIEARNNMGGVTPLMCAAQRDQTEFAKFLLARGADPTNTDDSGRAAYMFAEDDELRELLGGPSGKLCAAVRMGDQRSVEEIAQRNPELVACADGEGNTPIVVAIEHEHWAIAHWLARHTAAKRYVNTHGAQGSCPLHLAVRAEQTELVHELIENGADPNAKSIRKNEYTKGNYDMVDPVTGAKKAVSSEHRTALFDCAENGNVDLAKILIDSGCDADSTDGDGCTALYVSIEEDQLELAELLLSRGATPDIGNADIGRDNTLLAWAASRRQLALVQLLLKHGADPNRAGKSGMFALHMAARCGGKAVIEALLANGADTTKKCFTSDGCGGVTARELAEKNKRAVAAGCLDVL
eukprot:COSAG02_NODE_9429_length_2219_cov_2.393396_1_plen_513_part_01